MKNHIFPAYMVVLVALMAAGLIFNDQIHNLTMPWRMVLVIAMSLLVVGFFLVAIWDAGRRRNR